MKCQGMNEIWNSPRKVETVDPKRDQRRRIIENMEFGF